MWFNLAASQNDDAELQLAKNLRDMVEPGMTPAQITEAQKLARDWKSKSSSGGPWDDYKPDAPQSR